MTIMKTLVIRKAATADMASVAQVQIASWRAAYRGVVDDEFLAKMNPEVREQMWVTACSRTSCTLLVAALDGDVVAFCYFGTSQVEEEPAELAEIWAIYAHPDVWGMGVGRALMQEAFESLRSVGYRSVFLWVLRDNTRTRLFYEAAGMVLTGGEKTWKSASQELPLVRYEKLL